MNTPPPRGAYAYYVLAVLCVVYVFNFLDRQILAVLLVDIQAELGASDTLMGLLSGPAFAIFYTLAGLPIARWADRGMRRTVLATGVGVWSFMTALCGAAQNYVHLLLARIGVGAGEAAGTPPSHALISDYFPPHSRPRALAIYGVSLHVGIFFGLAVGGWLNEIVGWRMAFVCVGIPGIFLSVLVRLTVREPPRGAFDSQPRSEAGESIGGAFRRLLGLRSYRYLLFGAALVSLPGIAYASWVPTFMRRIHEMGSAEAGAWVGLATLGGAAGTYVGGELSGRLGARDARWYLWLPTLSSLAKIPLALLFVFWPSGVPPLPLYAAVLFVSGVYTAPTWTLFQSLAPPHLRTFSSALNMFASNLIGLGAGPLVVGVLNDLLAPRYGEESIRYTLGIVLVVAVVGAALLFSGGRSLRDDLPSAERTPSM